MVRLNNFNHSKKVRSRAEVNLKFGAVLFFILGLTFIFPAWAEESSPIEVKVEPQVDLKPEGPPQLAPVVNTPVDPANEARKQAKKESEEEVRLSMLNQLHIREVDKKKETREEVKLDLRTGSPVIEVKAADLKPTDVPMELAKGSCGILLDFMGKVEILDSTRSHILDSNINMAFPCASWVSTRNGWALIKYRDGQKIRLGHETLVQIEGDSDQITLYRGSSFVESGGGEGELRLATAIGRARVKRGKLVFLNAPESDTTQLIALEGSCTLENRFETSRRVELHAGETSELNFKQLRVIPLLPESVASTPLKATLDQLEVSDAEKAQAIRVAIARHEKKFAILRKEDIPDKSEDAAAEENSGGGRSLASVADQAKKRAREKLAILNRPYLRNQDDPVDPKLKAALISRITGGVAGGEKWVNPQVKGSPNRAIAGEAVGEEDRVTSQSLLPAEEEAKKKLIHVLSEIKIE